MDDKALQKLDDKPLQKTVEHSPEAVAAAKAALKRRERQPPKFQAANDDGEALELKSAEGIEPVVNYARQIEATGVADAGLISKMLNQVAGTGTGQTEDWVQSANNCLAIMHDIHPQNALEGLLTVQIVGTHNLAMEMLGRANAERQTVEGVDRNINRATKLLRTFTAQIETLQKLRGKKPQKVIVEHVHVHKGGQAIVGNVEHKGGGE